MSDSPIITFKAGICDFDESVSPPVARPRSTPGYIYLYSEDDIMHFCWRPRSAPLNEPELDLLMLPTDGTFLAYKPRHSGNTNTSKATNGRIYVLEFSSSSQKHLFWLQSRSQHPNQDASWFSARDLRLGEIVNDLLQGEDVDVPQAIAEISQDEPGDDEDETMEDVEGTGGRDNHHRSGSGGAGPGATGGDVREEGEGAREAGADGGRATNMDAQSIIQNFINSVNPSGTQSAAAQPRDKLFTTLADLLTPPSTISYIEEASEESLDQLLQYLPPSLIGMAQQADDSTELNTETSTQAAKQALSIGQKKEILRKVLRSPQFSQSLSSLTVAIRDGGLPIISESLNIAVRNGGYMRRGGVPLGGGEAVEAFLEGVKDSAQKDNEDRDRMDTQ